MRHILFTLALTIAPAAVVAQEVKGRDSPADKAVEKALEYLAAVQEKDGSWRLNAGKSPAATSLAVRAFLAVGNVPGKGKYGEAIEKGIRWVMKQQTFKGLIGADYGHEMYHHGICTTMLAEAAGMVEGQLAMELRKALQEAVKLILRAQRTRGEARGGWRYQIQAEDSDLSVTGWQIVALHASKKAGCDVPPEAIEKAVDYVKRCQDSATGGFAYMPNYRYTIPCTGTGILALALSGKDMHHSPELLKAGAFLLKNPPKWSDPYFFYMIYYCTQATFRLGDDCWKEYGPKAKQVLLEHQQPDGSWGRDSRDAAYGPAYCTSMAVLALTAEHQAADRKKK